MVFLLVLSKALLLKRKLKINNAFIFFFIERERESEEFKYCTFRFHIEKKKGKKEKEKKKNGIGCWISKFALRGKKVKNKWNLDVEHPDSLWEKKIENKYK